MEDRAILVLCTAPDETVGAELARGLVEARLAACVNLIPGVRSFYTWQGKLEDDNEVQLFVKTRESRFDAVNDWLQNAHPYDVPEVLALPITAGAGSYLKWLREQTTE